MAQNVEFKLKFTLDGKEHIIATTDDVKQLTKELGLANVSGDRLRDSLLKFNNISTAFQNAAQGLQELTGSLLELSGSYASQQVIEAKLANNMRNTMDAREEDIESIRQLCEAQKQLGIIDDEVQMAGAQELATYLEKKSSLEALIPVMNDMLAQQYGLEASEESAAQIASMLGKVMEGQTAALSRYGYSFDEAQEQILKFGTEEERAAVLAEVVESAVGGMNEALRQTPAGRAKALADKFDDVKKAVGGVVQAFAPAIVAADKLASGLNTTVTAVSGIAGAARTVKSLAAALNLSAKAARAASLAVKGILISSGVGVAVWALAEAFAYFAGKADESTDAMKRAEQEARNLKNIEDAGRNAWVSATTSLKLHTSRLEELIQAKKDGRDVSQDEKKAVDELNATYGTTMGYFDSVNKWYDALIANSENYCRQMVIEAKTRELANQIAAREEKIHSIEFDESGKRRPEMDDWTNETRSVPVYSHTTQYGGAMYTYRDEEVPNSSPAAKAREEIEAEQEAVRDLQRRMEEYVKEAANLSFKVKGADTQPTGGKKGKGGDEHRLSLIENATTYEQLANNVRYYQQELEETNITDTERIQTLAKAKAATEEAIEQYRKLATVSKSDDEKRDAELAELEASEVASLKEEEIKTQDQLSAKMAYYNRLQQLGTEDDRVRAQQGIRELEAIGQAWDMVADKSRFQLDETGEIDPSAIFNPKDIDAAIRFYTERQQGEDADQIGRTQALIDRLTERQRAIRLGIELPSMRKEADEIAKLTGRDYTVKVKAMGFEQIMAKIRELGQLLENPHLTDDQREQLEKLRGMYARFAQDSVKGLDTYRKGWDGVKGIGSGIEGITQALEGNQNAWQTLTAVVDAGLQIYDGIQAVVKLIEMLTGATQMQTAAKQTETQQTLQGAGATVADTALTQQNTLAALENTAANSGESIAEATKQGAKLPFPMNLVAIAAGVAAVVSALAMIGSFATGGIVGGSSPTGDRLLARVNSGEMILNQRQQRRLWELLNGQAALALPAAYAVPRAEEVRLDVGQLRSQMRPYAAQVAVSGRLRAQGRDLVAVIETEESHRRRT